MLAVDAGSSIVVGSLLLLVFRKTGRGQANGRVTEPVLAAGQ
jgi:hypothetical protein